MAIKFYHPKGRRIEQFFNVLAVFSIKQQYELASCFYKLSEYSDEFINYLLELNGISKLDRIGITHLLMLFYGDESYLKSRYLPRLSESEREHIFKTTRLLLTRYRFRKEKVFFILNGLARQNKLAYLKRLFSFLDQLEYTWDIPHFIDKISLVPPNKHEELFKILNKVESPKPFFIRSIINDLIFYEGSVLEKAYPHLGIIKNSRWRCLMLDNSIFIPPEKHEDYFRLYNDRRCWFDKHVFRWSQIFVIHPHLKDDCHRYIMEKLKSESGEAVLLAECVQKHFKDLHIPRGHPIRERCASLLEPDDSLQLEKND